MKIAEMDTVENTSKGVDLEELANKLDDITDPSSMDTLLEYVDMIRAEDDQFIELLVEKCENAIIYWERPWYQECIRVGFMPKPEEGDGRPMYRVDPFSLEEHEMIEHNWHKFIKKFKLPDQIVSLARWRRGVTNTDPRKVPQEKARRYAVAYLSRGLERTTNQVYVYLSDHYGGYRKGNFSDIDERIMNTCFYHQPKMMGVILTMLLGRRKRGIYKRLKQLANGKPEKKKIKWTLPLASKFVNHLLDYTQLPLDELKNKQFDNHIWRRLEDVMDHNYIHLHHFWYCYLHVQLFVRRDIKLKKLKRMLFKNLREKAKILKYRIWSDIRWKHLVEEFPDGFTHRFLYRICYNVIKGIEGYLRMPLLDLTERALVKLKKQRSFTKNKRLKTLQFTEAQQLEPIDYRSMESNK